MNMGDITTLRKTLARRRSQRTLPLCHSPGPRSAPSRLEQRTGRVDRIGAKVETCRQPIRIYLPFIAETQDDKCIFSLWIVSAGSAWSLASNSKSMPVTLKHPKLNADA
jgi:hypothetical protein